MNTEPNAKKHLTPRQIINRFRKGVYVDESNEMISSAISSCGQAFDSIALSLPTTLPGYCFLYIGHNNNDGMVRFASKCDLEFVI